MWNSSRGDGMLHHWYKQIYARYCHSTTLTINMFRNLLKKIYIAFKNISLTGRAKNQDQDGGGQIANFV